MADEAVIRCPTCREVLKRTEEVAHPDGQAHVDIYTCPGCGLHAALMWELSEQANQSEAAAWLEREVRRRGSFFPTDFT